MTLARLTPKYRATSARLLANPELCGDVAFCLRVDFLDTVAEQGADGVVRAI